MDSSIPFLLFSILGLHVLEAWRGYTQGVEDFSENKMRLREAGRYEMKRDEGDKISIDMSGVVPATHWRNMIMVEIFAWEKAKIKKREDGSNERIICAYCVVSE